MPKTSLALLFVALFIAPLYADTDTGHLSITGKVSIYNPPGDADAAPLFNIDARYRLSSRISLVGSGGWCSYNAGDTDITFIPISARALFHVGRSGNLDPYVGAGLALNMRSYDYPEPEEDDSDATGGAELIGGVSYRPGGGFGLDFDVIYRIEDLSDTGNSKSWSFGGGVRGTVDFDL